MSSAHSDARCGQEPTAAELRDWAAATDLRDLGELCAQWLRGKRSWLPTYCDSQPAAETSPRLVTALVAVNRAGWLTDSSQPGLIDGDLRQRAFVAGLIEPEFAAYAEHVGVDSDLVVLRGRRPRRSRALDPAVDIAVTAWAGEAETSCGRFESQGESLALYGAAPRAARSLRRAAALQVIDPVWGRDDRLWSWLHRFAGDITSGVAHAWFDGHVRNKASSGR